MADYHEKPFSGDKKHLHVEISNSNELAPQANALAIYKITPRATKPDFKYGPVHMWVLV